MNSDLFYPHYFLGSIRRIQKQNNQAIKSIKKALKLQPNNHEALKELALNYIATNKIRPAIEIYQGFLINKPKDQIYQLLKSCNLTWSDNCLKFYNNKRPIKTNSDSQARQKIYKTSVDSWKNYENDLKSFFTKLKI